jgi:hypothetical protein
MKKQLLIAAVAATMGTAAIADVSISGNAKFEYQNVETTGVANVNKTNTEVNLKLRGKNGDTSVVMDIAANGGATAADSASERSGLVVEDMYLTTKVADVTVKAGNYASGTSGILGEIDNGSRSNNKVTLSTTLGGVKVYVGNAGTAAASTGFTTINNNMFAGISMDVAGVTVQAKKVSDTEDAFGISGDMSGVAFRLEQKQGTGSNTDVVFGNVTTDVNGISLGYAWIDADADSLIAENDSAIFAVENGSNGDSNQQFVASTSVQGNKVTLKSGTIGFKAATLDRDYTQVSVSRPLASGATASVTYTDKELTDTTDSQTFEAELSVKF